MNTSYVTVDDMAAALFALGVERLSTSWELAVGLMVGAIVTKFAKGLATKYEIPVSFGKSK
jgi:hypothetical protein